MADANALPLIRESFAEVDPDFPRHVCLREMLHAPLADAIHWDLEHAPFRRHHHGPYPLHIAPLEALPPGTLAAFCAWMQSSESAAFHAALVGWPAPLRTRQVQVSRMNEGEYFPPHVDTEASGLAVIYNFSRDWTPSYGGALAFPHPRVAGRDGIVVPALFNSCFIFHTTGARHRVTPIAPEAAGHSRYSITAFMLED